MAVTEQSYVGNGSTTNYAFTFPYLKASDVKVQLDATETAAWTFANATTVQMNSAPASGVKIKILRDTNVDNLTATFYAGSAIKSEDLNDNFTQNLYVTQETGGRSFQTTGGTITGDVHLGEDVNLTFEGGTDNAYETTLTVTDPTADRTITLPNETGTVLTTGSSAVISSSMITDGTIVAADLANNAVTTAKITDANVTTAKLAADAVTGAKIADDSINSEHYVDGSIDTAHIADNQVTTAKIAADAITGAKLADDSVDSEHYAADSIDAEHYAPGSVDATALASNAVTQAKIADDAVGPDELAASAVVTGSIVDNAVTLAKMADSSVGTAELVADSVTGAKIADDQIDSEHYVDGSIDTAHIADNAVTTGKIADAELTTLAGMQAGTASVLAGGTALAATLTEINTVCDGKGVHTTISDSDAHYPTSGAVVDYVSTQLAAVGGFETIATDAAFPNTQPASGIIVSIADAGGLVVNGSGTSTTGRTVGSSTVTINGINSQFNSTTVAAGVAFMVESTGSGQIYNYHKATLKEADLINLSSDIDDFGNRYRVGTKTANNSNTNDDGDLFFDTGDNKMYVYDGAYDSGGEWKEVASAGDYKLLGIKDNGQAHDGSGPTFNGSNDQYDLFDGSADANITSAGQLLVSLNGVIQKPNASYDANGEGFALDGADGIRFCDPPVAGSSLFITQIGTATTLTTPSDNSVATAKIQNGAVTNAKIADDSIAEVKLDIHNAPSGTDKYLKYTSNGMEWATVTDTNTNILSGGTIAGDVTFDNSQDAGKDITWSESNDQLVFADDVYAKWGTGGDLQIYHNGSHSYIVDAGTGNLFINSNSAVQSNTDNFTINNNANSANIAIFHNTNGCQLYHTNVKEFETKSGGVKLYGHSESIVTALTSAASVTIDFSTANHFSCTMGHNITFNNPTTEAVGQSGTITLTQDGTGSRTASWGTQFLWAGGTAPTLSTAANAVDRIDYVVVASDKIHCVASLAMD